MFYYQLKKIDSNGFFQKGTISSLHEDIPYEQPTIWKKLKRLVDNQLIRKYANGYQLISYDELFAILGYNMTFANGRKGIFKIHKIPMLQCSNIKDLLAWIDIRENLNHQTNKAFNSLKKSSQYSANNLSCTTMQDKRKILSSIVDKNLVQMATNNDKHVEHCKYMDLFMMEDKSVHCNPDVTLSLEGICSILQLPNTSSAHNIIQRLSDQKRISVTNREIFIESTTMTYQEIKQKFGDSYILREGAIFRTLTNSIKCINY